MLKQMRTIVPTSEGEQTVSLSCCTCIFNTAMSLPCRHMFALRAMLVKPLFDENLCEKRWTLVYYRGTQRFFPISTEHSKVVQTTPKTLASLASMKKFASEVNCVSVESESHVTMLVVINLDPAASPAV